MLNSKFWQAFFALAPILVLFGFFIVYFVFLFSVFSNIEQFESDGNASASLILGNLVWFIVFIAFTILISFGSLIFYIVHAVQNPNLKDNNLLIVWILLFVFVSGIGQLIYWLVEIVSKRKNIAT